MVWERCMFGNQNLEFGTSKALPARGQEEAGKRPRNLTLEPPRLYQQEARRRQISAYAVARSGTGLSRGRPYCLGFGC